MNASAEQEKQFNYLYGLINFAVIFGIVLLLWLIFMHPKGPMQLYTPMYGFSLIVCFLTAIVLMVDVAGYYPFSENPSEKFTVILRGITLTVVSFILMLFLFYIVFWGFIGKFGVAYFSPKSIMAAGGMGSDLYIARESACTALVFFFTSFLWLALSWNVGFGSFPWNKDSRGVLAWSRFFAVTFFTTIVYAVMFHPNVCYLFYPPQTKAGVAAWWASFTGTGSAFFGLGLLIASLAWIIFSDLLWEGYPWKLLEKDGEGTFLKGIVTFIATLVLGIITLLIVYQIMNWFWDTPFEGGQYTDAPYFRYLHVAEVSGFFILAAFILKTSFNNFPNISGLWPRAIIRTVIAIVGGIVIHLFYYSAATVSLLGKVPGFGQPEDTPLVWTILYLCVIMIQDGFFDGWPLRKR
jgi:AAT family amino acid transporter